MSTNPKPRLTPEQYLEIERKAEFKSEFYDGEMFAMSGATENHGAIVSNISVLLVPALRRRCKVITNDLRVLVNPTGLYTYPDIVVGCGERKYIDGMLDTLTNPTILVEVLSPSTESYDRGKKFDHYRTISSLRHYVLVSSERPHVDVFSRTGDGWSFSAADGIGSQVYLDAVGITLPLVQIYEEIEF